MLTDNRQRPRVRLVEQVPNFFVDNFADTLGVVALFADVAAEEDHLLFATERHWPETLAHPELRNHAPDDTCGTLDVSSGAGARFSKHEGFRRVAAEGRGDRVAKLATRHIQPVFSRQKTCVAR